MSSHRRASSSERRSEGHTLWEVLLVLAVVGTVAALAAPSVRLVRPPADDVTRTTGELVDLLARARLAALEGGTTVELRLDLEHGRAWMLAHEADSLRLLATPSIASAAAVEIRADRPRVTYTFLATGDGFGQPLTVRGVGGVRRIVVETWNGGPHVVAR